jgi:mono/diheme cytochrome c family protein
MRAFGHRTSSLAAATVFVSSLAPPSGLAAFHGPEVPAAGHTRGAPVSRSQPGASAAVGSYTTGQADRGKDAYEANCSSCHGASLRGGANEFAAPALAGPFFYEKWAGRPLGELFRYAADTMPPDQARLSESTYLDVTAYILQVLKYPAGSTDLTVDSPAMKQAIERK